MGPDLGSGHVERKLDCLLGQFGSPAICYLHAADCRRASHGLTGSETRSHTKLPTQTSPKNLNSLQGGFGCCLQQVLRILLWIALTEHCVARHQNFRARAHHVGNRV